jgi:GNAT superfamily N-acetyltransferase
MAVSAIRIVRLTPGDWSTLRRIRLVALADAPEAFGSTLTREQGLTEADWRGRLGPSRATFAAVAADGWAGTATGIRGDTAGPGTREEHAELVGMWVRAEWRRRGVGGLLVRTVMGWAAGAGYRVINLWVAVGNTAAESLYASQGFVRTGVLQPIRPTEPDRLELEMARPL